jgi:predicted outer membrane lipoprotein
VKWIDKFFQVIFARFRRQVGDSNLDAAWLRARNKVAWYLGIPLGCGAGIVVALFYSVSKVGTHIEHRRAGQLIAVAACVASILLLNQRFRKYLSNPPSVPSEESRADARLVFWFRLAVIGIFVVTCLTGILLHEAGVSFLEGF